MGIEVVLWITVRLLNAALLKPINIIKSFDALNIAHFPTLWNSANNDLLITLIVHAVASAEPSRRRYSSDVARTSSLSTFLSVESSIRSLDEIVLALGKYTACGLPSAAVSVTRLDICGSPWISICLFHRSLYEVFEDILVVVSRFKVIVRIHLTGCCLHENRIFCRNGLSLRILRYRSGLVVFKGKRPALHR